MHYQWTGIHRVSGQPTHGNMQAPSIDVAKVLLHQQGIDVLKIIKKKRAWFHLFSQDITSNEITQFSRHMATLLNAQIPLIQAFDALKTGHKNQALQTLLNTIKQDVQAGLTLANALRKHARYFNPLFCNLVQVGEQSGALALLLMKLAHFQEHMAGIRKKIRIALTYPLAILCLTLIIAMGLIFFVIPQFESLFTSFGAELPTFTRLIITLSNGLKTYWLGGLSLIIITATLTYYAIQHSVRVAHMKDKCLLALPWLGHVIEHAIIARLAHTLSITLTAGMPLTEALKATASVTGNVMYTNAMHRIHDDVTHGLTLQTAMEQSQRFPSLVIQMIAVGEESGQLEPMLAHIATQYDDLFNESSHSLNHFMEPLLMVILGIIIGTLIIAMYLPIFQLGAIV